MPEFNSRKDGYDNIMINERNIDVASFRLLSIFFADKEIQKLYTRGMFSRSWSIFEEIKEEHINHLLIEIAILYRRQESRFVMSPELKKEQARTIVGKLFQPVKTKMKPLTMIEACNKVIHADSMNYDVRKLPKSNFSYICPRIHLYGEKYGTAWKAVIDVTRYCEKALRMEPVDIGEIEEI